MTLLSICINTFNRADFLPETLDSMVEQLSPEVEIIVVDGGSTDGTLAVLQSYAQRYPSLRYLKTPATVGIDEGYDIAVHEAMGEYCWLMTDDDLARDGAIKRILSEIQNGYDLILVDIDCYTKDMRISFHHPLYGAKQDERFGEGDRERFAALCGKGISYIGSVVIRKGVWLETDLKPYYGSYFAHAAAIFQSTSISSVLLMSTAYIKYRSGNSSWTARSFEIWNGKWPDLIWSMPRLSNAEKALITPREPWRRMLSVVKSRALGEYDFNIFQSVIAPRTHSVKRLIYRVISITPRLWLSTLILLHCLMFKKNILYTLYNLAITHPNKPLAFFLLRSFGVKLASCEEK